MSDNQKDMLTLSQAIETLDDGIPTVIIPCFISTDKEKFVDEVIKKCISELDKPDLSRIYIFYQQGITAKSSRKLWNKIKEKGEDDIFDLYRYDRLRVYSFGNVPDFIIQAFFESSNIEIV